MTKLFETIFTIFAIMFLFVLGCFVGSLALLWWVLDKAREHLIDLG